MILSFRHPPASRVFAAQTGGPSGLREQDPVAASAVEISAADGYRLRRLPRSRFAGRRMTKGGSRAVDPAVPPASSAAMTTAPRPSIAVKSVAARSVATGGGAAGALAVGALALGALSLGALAIGAVAVGALAVGRARVRRLHVDELTVGRLRIGRIEGLD